MTQDQLIAGVTIKPSKAHQWTLSGPYGEFVLTLSDGGGWNLVGSFNGNKREEHHPMLHHALTRAYNFVMGFAT